MPTTLYRFAFNDIQLVRTTYFVKFLDCYTRVLNMSSSRTISLASRLLEPNSNNISHTHHSDDEDDDEALFAELEAEIENDDNLAVREQGLEILKRE
ncbi:hypothetical protein BDQ12DRAFT_674951 [Crucibulum laeve]|uniref:Uncharacterized protein n=1 Tax=Crucibulum laeve TaxID=68775 RepID=A0A5C3MDM9_9AGAR|nr:hypothetical protein BDQ12DRAFT_674951 [Crucibulum laeve]